jgi:hypothetical protein
MFRYRRTPMNFAVLEAHFPQLELMASKHTGVKYVSLMKADMFENVKDAIGRITMHTVTRTHAYGIHILSSGALLPKETIPPHYLALVLRWLQILKK